MPLQLGYETERGKDGQPEMRGYTRGGAEPVPSAGAAIPCCGTALLEPGR